MAKLKVSPSGSSASILPITVPLGSPSTITRGERSTTGYGLSVSHSSPIPSKSLSNCNGLGVSGQLSYRSAIPSSSVSR